MNAKVISVCNEKGGVGKSTIAVQVALELAERKHKVCIIDNDPSGDATTALLGQEIPNVIQLGNVPEAISNTAKLYTTGSKFEPLEVKENLFLMGATDALSIVNGADMEVTYEFFDSIELLQDVYDYIIIDCPPSFGLLFTAAMLASKSGGVMIPIIPDELSFKALKKVNERINQMNHRLNAGVNIIGIIPNKVVNNPMPQSVRHYLNEISEQYPSKVFKTVIHQTVKISDAISLNEKISDYAKPTSKAAVQLSTLTDELIERVAHV